MSRFDKIFSFYIIFPYNNVGGAFRSTYELSNELIKLGHEIRIYIPFFPYLDGNKFFSFEGFKIFVRGAGSNQNLLLR